MLYEVITSVIEDNFKIVDYGVIKTSPGDAFADRLLAIYTDLNNIIA